MFPASFNESTEYLSRPPGMTDDECGPLAVWRGHQQLSSDPRDRIPVVVSCWKPTQEELDEIIRTKRVWLFIYGETMPPAAIGGLDPFKPLSTGPENAPLDT